MPDEFIPLEVFFAPVRSQVEPPSASGAEQDRDGGAEGGGRDADCGALLEQTMREVRCFRAALADALDAAVDRLLPNVASEILARELQLAATDVRAIVAKTLERFGSERVLSIRVHPQALAALTESPVAVVADAALADGDLMVELNSGTIDMTLKVRVAHLLDASLA